MSGQRYSVTIDVGADISSAKSAAQLLKNVFEGIGLGAGQSSRISGMFKDLDKALDEVAKRSSTALTSIGEVKGLDKAKERVVSIINAINSEFSKMGKLGDTDLAKNFGDLTRRVNDASKAIKTYNSTIGSLSKGHAAAKSRANELGLELAELTKYYELLLRIRDKFKGSSDKDISEALAKRQSTAKGLATRRQNELESFVKEHGGRINADKTVDKGWRKSFDSKASAEDVETLNKLVTAALNASNAFKTALENYQNFSNAMSNFKGLKNFDELTKSAREAAGELKKFESGTLSTEAFNKLKSALELAFGPEVTAGIQNSATAVEEFLERINQISAKELDEFRKKVPEIDNLLNLLANTGEKMGEKVKKGTESFYNMKEAASEVDHLTSRLKYFFSLAGGFNLMRRAIRSAVTTTKELDAVMTQTAVVSLYSVGDMWKTLPKYSKEALKLGASIKDIYSALTLYVQLGLDMNSAMKIGVETMKMARVANINAEEATNSMTAALRGFNMELTERSAQRVNDVYSKLAQNTASNTQEISTAMTKTAAIANSANMSFENTAAFLATIIESTREGAETAGTALKTVIARFTEVKKLYSLNELKGTDEEGLEIDVNKISTALRTTGINMNDFFTGAKGLDEILMELGSKWDSLTTILQRYIATMAAGSRQQSRFLALMQNYSRTVELTLMAYNSTGSGLEQFDKTLDSLNAKISLLKDAWDTFVMGLADSSAIKGIVSLGTGILKILNAIINQVSGNNGLVKSVMSIVTAIGIFKSARGILKSVLGDFRSAFTGIPKDNKGGIFGNLTSARKTRAEWRANAKAGFSESARLFSSPFGGRGANKLYLDEARKQEADFKKALLTYDIKSKELESLRDEGAEKWAKRTGYKPSQALTEKGLGKAATAQAYNKAVGDKLTEVNESLTDLSNKIDESTASTENATAAMNNYAASMQAVSMISGVLAGLLGAFANYLKKIGYNKVAHAIEVIAIGLGALSAAAGIAGAAFTAMASAVAVGAMKASTAIMMIPIIGWAVAIITALTMIGMAIAKVVRTAKEQSEAAKKLTEEHASYLSEIKDKYSEINDRIALIGELKAAIDGMTKGTLEWKDAVAALNDNIRLFLKDYPEYMDAVLFNTETGLLEFNESKVKGILREQEEIVKNGDWGLIAFKINLLQKDTNLALKNNTNTSNITREDVKAFENDEILSKYNSEYIFTLLEKGFNKESAGILREIASSDIWNKVFPTEIDELRTFLDKLYNEEGTFVGGESFVSKDGLSFFQLLSDMGEYISKVETYGLEYSNTTGLIRPEAISYVLELGKGIVGPVVSYALEIYENTFDKIYDWAYSNLYNNNDLVTDEMIRDWATMNNYTYDAVNRTYSYEENGEKQIKGIDRDVLDAVRTTAATKYAKLAAEEETLKFLTNISKDYLLSTGLGTFALYSAAIGAGGDIALAAKLVKGSFELARSSIEGIVGEIPDFVDNLNFLQTSQISSIGKTWLTKFGKDAASSVLLNISKLSSAFEGDISLATDGLIYVLLLVESGAINNLEDFTEALGFYGIDAVKLGIDISKFLKKPKNFEQAQEDLKTGLEFWNTARSSTTFTEEDRNKLIQGGMSKEDFILTSEGYVSTKSTNATGSAAKQKLIRDTEDLIQIRDTLITALLQFNENLKNKGLYKYSSKTGELLTLSEILGSEKITDVVGNELIRLILATLTGGEIYNLNNGEMIKLDLIVDEDLAGYLLYYLDNAAPEIITLLIGEKGALNLELKDIKESKLLDLAPAIQTAIIDIITLATQNGIDFSDLDIDLVKNARIQFTSDKKYAEFLNGLDQLDWDEIDDIDDFTRKLKNLGIEFDKNSDGALNLFNRLQEIYATDTTPAQKAEKLLTKVEKVKSAAERLASGEKVFSKEDVENLRDVLNGEFKESDWKLTGSNEWLYVGRETNSLLSNIDGAVLTIATKINNEAKESILRGQYIAKKLNNEVHDTGLTTAEFIEKIRNGEEVPQGLEEWLMLNLGAPTRVYHGDKRTYKNLLNYYDLYYGENGEIFNANTASAGTDTLLYQLSGQGLLNDTDITDEKRSEVLDTKVKGLEAGEQYMVGKSMDSMLPAVKAIVEKGTIVGLEEDLEGVDKKTKDYLQTLNALTLDAKRDIKNFEDLSLAYKDNASALTTEKKGTAEYGRALGNLTASAKRAFNNNEVITEDFVENNLELFKDYSEGVEGSTEAIRDAVAQEMLKTGQNAEAVKTALTALDGAKFDINGNADFSNVFNLFAATEELADALAAVLRSLGYTVTLKMGDPVRDPANNEIVGYNWTASVSNSAGNVETANRGGGGGGGGGGGNKEFKNDFDKYYNQVEDINELERQRNLLEKDYNQLLKSEYLSGKEIYDNLKAQIELLKERRFLVLDLAEKRKLQILDTMQDEQYKDVAKYSWWNEEDQTIEIDWQSIDKIKDSETGDLVKEYVSKLEDFLSKYDELVEALEDIEDTLQEIKERGKDLYQTAEERLRDALIKQIQDKIDELTEVNEAINETNQKLFDSISETLELQRQERENAKTEEELADKEKRLAYLQLDSSNANALEIAKLQEELADARENYTDTLIDLKISELLKLNEEAQEQRQELIDLMQRSLEWQEKSGAFWNTVYLYISEGTDAIGALIPGSNLVRLLKDGEAWDSLSEEMLMNWLKELETLVSEATGYLALNRLLEDIGTKEGTEIEFITADGRTLKGKVDKNGNVVVNNDDGSTSTYKDVYLDYYGTYKTLETEGELKEAPKPATTTKPEGTEVPPTYTGEDELLKEYYYPVNLSTCMLVEVWKKKGEVRSARGHVRETINHGNDYSIVRCKNCGLFLETSYNAYDTEEEEKNREYMTYNGPSIGSSGVSVASLPAGVGGAGLSMDELLFIKLRYGGIYATGGLADFTGPAWLDGTKSNPELVLNARDTQNFIELKDVLADMRKNGGLLLTGGDNYYDIKVQVDSLGSDYDVDRAIDRIKARIAQDGAYRNVNTLSRLR